MEKIKKREYFKFNIVSAIIIGIIAVICLLPFMLIISGSLSSEAEIMKSGYGILPKDFSISAYKSIFKRSNVVLFAYRNTIFITIVGTMVGLFVTSMTAYVLQRRDFIWRNQFSYLFYFTTLFSGGLVPWYLLMIKLGMDNNIASMIIPGMLSVFNILIMRNFMKAIPDAVTESAQIDGANDFHIYWYLILPLSKSSLATIGLFLALEYWNSWYNCMLFIKDESLYSLQYYLYNMLNSAEYLKRLSEGGSYNPYLNMIVMPSETLKLAMTIVATGPILLVYPFIQKYFVKGITIGAVKG